MFAHNNKIYFIIDYTSDDTVKVIRCRSIDEANDIIDHRIEELKGHPIFNNLSKSINFDDKNISVVNTWNSINFNSTPIRRKVIHTIEVVICETLDEQKTNTDHNTIAFDEMYIKGFGYVGKVFKLNDLILTTNGFGKIYGVCIADDISESTTLTDFVKMFICHKCKSNNSLLVSKPIILLNE